VRAAHIQLLAVADHRPVQRRLRAEHRKLDQASELANQLHALIYADWRAGGFDMAVMFGCPD
jgi:hypothetical protein